MPDLWRLKEHVPLEKVISFETINFWALICGWTQIDSFFSPETSSHHTTQHTYKQHTEIIRIGLKEKKQRVKRQWWFTKLTFSGYVGVSKNRGTPKWMVKKMENPVEMDDLGVPLCSETSMFRVGVPSFREGIGNAWFWRKRATCTWQLLFGRCSYVDVVSQEGPT